MPSAGCGFNDVAGGASGTELLAVWGPTLLVDIGFDPNYNAAQATPPIAGIQGIYALVDTGASESCIDSLLATQLNLPVVDRQTVSGAHGGGEVNMHLAQVHIPNLGKTIYGIFAGVHLQAGGQVHKALIGRTFLRHCKMVYDGQTGNVTIEVVQPPPPLSAVPTPPVP
jgi:predicted aspartyl protease